MIESQLLPLNETADRGVGGIDEDLKGFEKNIYLRVILNSVCNAKCYFCHEEGAKVMEDLPADILLQAVEDSASLGLKKVKYTGGEPLLRKDLAFVTKMIKTVNPDVEISMTTNGIRILKTVDDLVESGLDRMNVSLHSLDKENYKRICGVDALDKVLAGLDYVKMKGMKDLKINMTVSTYNMHEIFDLAKYSSDNGFEFRLHDLLPSNEEARMTMVSKRQIKNYLKDEADRFEIIDRHGKKTTRFHKDGYMIDVKSGRFNKRCGKCEYLTKCNEGIYAVRLTPDGILRPCLYRDDLQIDYKEAIQRGTSRSAMLEAYKRVVT